MNIRKTSIVGFTQIFTPDHLDKEGVFISDKPSYIIFIMPISAMYEKGDQKENLNELYLDRTLVQGITILGMTACKKNHYVITVTGDRKVAEAIKLFRQLEEYPAEQNQELLIYLDQYQAICEEKHKSKLKKIPSKSKSISLFANKDGSKLDLTLAKKRSFNQTIFLKEINSDNKWVLKLYRGNRTIANFEVFSGEICELFLGSRVPETIGIHGEEGERIGSASRFYDRYTSIRDYVHENNKKVDADLIVSSEMIKIFVLSYMTNDDDANSSNYGFVKFLDQYDNTVKLLAVNIDHDRKLWHIVCTYFRVDPNVFHREANMKPTDTFPVRTLKISRFPWTEYQPACGIVNSYVYEKDSWEKAAKIEKFNYDKYYMFIKIAITPKEIIENIANAVFYSDNKKKLAAGEMTRIIEDLRFAFDHDEDNDKEVQKFLISYKATEILMKILGEFKEYNKKKQAEGYLQLQIDLKKVAENFHQLRANAKRSLSVFPHPEPIPQAADPSLPLAPVVPSTPNTPNTPQTPNNENADSHSISKKRKHGNEGNSASKRFKLNPVVSSLTKNNINASNASTSTESSGTRTPSILRSYLTEATNNFQASKNIQVQPTQYYGTQSNLSYNYWQQSHASVSLIPTIPSTQYTYSNAQASIPKASSTIPTFIPVQPSSSISLIPTMSSQNYHLNSQPLIPAVLPASMRPPAAITASRSHFISIAQPLPQAQPIQQQQNIYNANNLPPGFPIDAKTFKGYSKGMQAQYIQMWLQRNPAPQQQPAAVPVAAIPQPPVAQNMTSTLWQQQQRIQQQQRMQQQQQTQQQNSYIIPK
jgi:hypothetical protein